MNISKRLEEKLIGGNNRSFYLSDKEVEKLKEVKSELNKITKEKFGISLDLIEVNGTFYFHPKFTF